MLYANCTNGELRTESDGIEDNENVTRGRLEICSNQVWFSVYYSYSWYRSSSVTAGLACRSLGYGDIGISLSIN